NDYYFLDLPSPFPAARRPVIHVPTIRVSQKSTDSEMRIWVARIDQIIRGRLDRKGIIHTVSYARARFLRENSEYANLMLVPTTGEETKRMVAEFKESPDPKLLVSQSVHTGYD